MWLCDQPMLLDTSFAGAMGIWVATCRSAAAASGRHQLDNIPVYLIEMGIIDVMLMSQSHILPILGPTMTRLHPYGNACRYTTEYKEHKLKN